MRNTTNSDYDVILIGSGMGSLTVASLMARLRDKRVLVLERHFKAGGFTHTFQRKDFHWDVGLHYVGQMSEGDMPGRLMALVTDGRVCWAPMPDLFERLVYPDFTFDVRRGRPQFEGDLVRQFPGEATAIKRYLRDVARASASFAMWTMRRNGSLVARLAGTALGWFRPTHWELTTRAYLDSHFRGPALKAVLTYQWGDHGLTPRQSPFVLHSLIVNHYLNGAYYPVGGAGRIAAAVQQTVEAAGGTFLVSREVTEILVDDDRAVGVKVRKTNDSDGPTEEYRAPVIVSGLGAAATSLRLVPAEYPIPFRDDLRQFVERHPPRSNVTLYLGMSGDPRRLGFQGENYWFFAGYDHDDSQSRLSEWVEGGEIPFIYLSFPSLKDRDAKTHTAEIIAWTDYQLFAPWRTQSWRKRDADYQELKDRISRRLIEAVDRRYPGFADLVAFHELSTPITTEYFTGHTAGGIYGLPALPERFDASRVAWTHPRTPIPGLYLTGVDVAVPGIVGALIGGVTIVSHLPDGISTPEVFRAATKFVRTSGIGHPVS
jgi:all-trans-retinol 13,14-reductase